MNTVSTEYGHNKIHSHKFALWVAIATIIMMFGAFTSAYIVRRAAGNWYEFKLPDIFFLNTLVIVASSVTLHASYRAFFERSRKTIQGAAVGYFCARNCICSIAVSRLERYDSNGGNFHN